LLTLIIYLITIWAYLKLTKQTNFSTRMLVCLCLLCIYTSITVCVCVSFFFYINIFTCIQKEKKKRFFLFLLYLYALNFFWNSYIVSLDILSSLCDCQCIE
jgi:hypothetical protein